MRTSPPSSRLALTAAGIVAGACAVVFWRTAYPSINWWESSSYSVAAATLGINSPPGSLALTLLGWPVSHLPFVASPAHALNLFAGLLAAIAAGLVCIAALDLLAASRIETGHPIALATGAAAGAFTFAFAGTLWIYGTQFTPYVLSTVMTGVLWWILIHWWRDADAPDAGRWIVLLAFAFGLDFSVHRTNALLIPGTIVWILLRKQSVLREVRTLVAAGIAFVLALSMQLLLIPMARHNRSPIDWTHPATLRDLWDYVSLKQLGGSFLLDLIPRRAPLWSVQTMDFLRVLGTNFFSWTGRMSWLGVLPACAAVICLVALWRAHRRLAIAATTVLVLQAALTVFYFNIPANFFRTLDRHYLPVCLTIAIFAACGLAVVADWMFRMAANMRAPARVAAFAAGALVAIVPAVQVARNWRTHDASSRWFARDYAENALRSLPPNAIYFTVGDNDTFPVLYMQSVEGLRRDVSIINLSIANVPEWPELARRRGLALPVSLSADARRALVKRRWTDTTVVVPVNPAVADLSLPAATPVPSSISFDVKPRDGDKMIPAEVVLLDIVRTNAWKRPLTFAATGTEKAMEWLAPYGRLDGLYYRVTGERKPPPDVTRLRAALLDSASYRGYADSSEFVDVPTQTMGWLAYQGIGALVQAEAARGDTARCGADRREFYALVPPARISDSEDLRAPLDRACH